MSAWNAGCLWLNPKTTSMSLFTSNRERRLWLWTLAVVAAIYSTLGLASMLAEVLRERGMNDNLAAGAFLGALLHGAERHSIDPLVALRAQEPECQPTRVMVYSGRRGAFRYVGTNSQ